MGPDWWRASDGKWYAPELHPDFHEAPTTETPAAGSAPPTLANPVVPGGGVDAPKDPNRAPLALLAVVFVLIALLAGGCVAFILTSRQSSSDEATAPTKQEPAPSTTSEFQRPTSTGPESSPEPETSSTAPEQSVPETTPTTTTTSTSLVPAPPATEPQASIMPDVVCMDLQQAQDTIQTAGVFFSRSFDASGEGRNQIVDRNWIVVSQDPPAGSPIDEGRPNLGAVKKNEPNPC